ncbi:MAG: serine/threonine-protein kinase [Myxococcota bacterium]
MIDVWIVDHPLGRGGFGSVYRCRNKSAARILAAVKVLDEALGRSAEAKARFIREAEILYALDHPNIVKVRNVRMDGPKPYLEMEFVDGIDLERRLRRGPIALPDALPLFEQVADALAYLHRQGVRHRDVKPGNIVLRDDGSLKLVDFGIATEGDGAFPAGGDTAFGSLAYVPPEWLESDIDQVRWDVYAAGLVFWEVLTGREAFPLRDGAGLKEEVDRVLGEKQRAPFLALPGFPSALSALVADMTRTAPGERLHSFEEVRERLAAVRAEVEADLARHVVPPAFTRSDPGELARGRAGATADTLPDPAHDTLVPPPSAVLRLEVPAEEPPIEDEAAPTLAVPRGAPTWRSSLPGATAPRGDDPSYAVARSKRASWLEVRWGSPDRFREWCTTQLLNYTLVLPEAPDVLPTRGPIRVLISHEDVQIDCAASVQAQGPASVSYRLELDLPQIERLRRWIATCAALATEVCH